MWFTKEYIYFSLFFQWQYTNLNYGWYLMLLPRFINALNIESIHVFVYDWEEWFVFKVHVWMCWNAHFDLSRFPEGWEIYCTYPLLYLFVCWYECFHMLESIIAGSKKIRHFIFLLCHLHHSCKFCTCLWF